MSMCGPEFFLDKIDEYWKKDFFLKHKERLVEQGKSSYYTEKKLPFGKRTDKMDDSIISLFENGDITIEDISVLFMEKLENSNKKIQLYKINSSVEDKVLSINKRLTELYNQGIYEKSKLCKSIFTKVGDGLNLIYVNNREDANQINIVYNYLVKWSCYEDEKEGSAKKIEKSEVIPVVITIDKSNLVAQLRIKKHNECKNIEHIKKLLITNLVNILEITEDDISLSSLRNSVNALFGNNVLNKYMGIHSSTDQGQSVKISFSLDGAHNSKFDYSKLKPYTVLDEANLLKSKLKICGYWNTKNIKDVFMSNKRLITFDIEDSEITINSDYRERETDYVLSHITKNL